MKNNSPAYLFLIINKEIRKEKTMGTVIKFSIVIFIFWIIGMSIVLYDCYLEDKRYYENCKKRNENGQIKR